MESRYPYYGSPWKQFRELPQIDPYEGYHRFAGRGDGCWELIRDKIRNDRTADLLAAAERLLGDPNQAVAYGPHGGIGIDQGEVWVGFLDGGVGVEVHIGEDEETNRPQGWQRTTIRGPRALRCLLGLLGFNWIEGTLTGEDGPPDREEVIREVSERLAVGR